MLELCRGVSAPRQYADLMRDCARLADVPLEGYRTFIDEFVSGSARWRSCSATKGTVEVDPVVLQMDVDDYLCADHKTTEGVADPVNRSGARECHGNLAAPVSNGRVLGRQPSGHGQVGR